MPTVSATWPPASNIVTTGYGKNSFLPSILSWGSEGMSINGNVNVIVKTCRAIPMVEEIKIEGGSGQTYTQILINDGDEVEITVIDDRALTFPQPGTPVTLINPQPNGTNGTSELFQTINNNWSGGRKVDGERTLMCKKYIYITPTQM